jgi:hypothetical protein
MIFSRSFKVIVCFALSFLMSNITQAAVAGAQMLPTSTVVEQLDRAQIQSEVSEYLKREDVKKALIENGVSPDEASQRLASLSPIELRQLSIQLQDAKAGGDILVTVLIVVLIIFLIRRI